MLEAEPLSPGQGWQRKRDGTKAKTKWGNAEFSETVEGSSGVMSKSQEEPTSHPPSALSTDPLSLWVGSLAGSNSFTNRASFLFSISLIAT